VKEMIIVHRVCGIIRGGISAVTDNQIQTCLHFSDAAQSQAVGACVADLLEIFQLCITQGLHCSKKFNNA
jgi:hypothetical protein